MAIFLSIGTNLGKKFENVLNALKELANYGKIEAVSNLYETRPIDMEGENFYNCVVKYQTYLSPYDLLRVVKRIEFDIGRDDSQGHNLPRIIDIDILIYDNIVMNDEELVIPHPKLLERDFLLKCLLDIDEDIYLHWINQSLTSFYRERFKDSFFKLVREQEELIENLMTVL